MNKRIVPVVIILILLVVGFAYFEKNREFSENANDKTSNLLIEKNTVEKYIRDNIKTIAIDKPVLGGSWYVVSIEIFPSLNSGTVVYEDGHIQSNSDFTYDYDKNTKNIIIKSFLQNK